MSPLVGVVNVKGVAKWPRLDMDTHVWGVAAMECSKDRWAGKDTWARLEDCPVRQQIERKR